MSKNKKTLMGHEINRARLRILTPIGEESSLSPAPSSPITSKTVRTSESPEPRLKYPRDHQLVLISDNLSGFEPYKEDIIPPVPSPRPIFEHRSRELDALVDTYLVKTHVPKQGRRHDVAYCECCENVNTVNREKRKQYWGKLPQLTEHDADPAKTLDISYYGLLKNPAISGALSPRINGTLSPVQTGVPVHENRYEYLYPTLASRLPYNDVNKGSASLMYPYLPRNYFNFDGYYNEWGQIRNVTNPPYERHLAEDVMQAASNYDASMSRLKGTVNHFSQGVPRGAFT